jgi:hypothetical protein
MEKMRRIDLLPDILGNQLNLPEMGEGEDELPF